MTRHLAGRRTTGLFSPAPGSRPAVLAGLGNGIVISAPLPAGIATGNPQAAAWATLGAYLAAFTNKGGPRGPRTCGLLVAAVVDAAVFWIGARAAGLFPVTLAVLAALVFLAGMGTTVHPTLERLGTMPATALLVAAGAVGTTQTPAQLRPAALLVLAGGLWYAAATAVLTPAPRLRDVLHTLAQPYRAVGRTLSVLAVAQTPRTAPAHTADALRRAEAATRALRGPRGDEHLAELTDPLVRKAATLADLTAALAATGPPPAAVATPYTTATTRAAQQLARLADDLTRRRPATPHDSAPETSIAPLEAACDRMRAQSDAGAESYPDTARAGRQRRLLGRIDAVLTTARTDAHRLAQLARTPLPPPTTRAPRPTAARLRDAMTLTSATFRHALRATTVSTAVFALTQATALPHGEWATLAVLRVLRPQYAVTRERVVQRVVGNLVGGSCAALLIAAVHTQAAICLILFVIITAGFTLRPVNYAFWVIFGTPVVLLIGDVSHPGDWHDALVRIAMTFLGTAAALLGSRLLWPSWEHPRLAAETDHARRATAAYLDTALRSLAGPAQDGELAPARPAPDVELAPARAAAEKAVARAQSTAHHAHREPGHDRAALDREAATVAALDRLVALIAALMTHRTARAAHVPALALYTGHAARALDPAPGEDPAVHTDALAQAVEEMSLYLEDLHTRRRQELASEHTGDTAVRVRIRETAPVIELLAGIADTLPADPGPSATAAT
ncbi:FUSC family protein [Streptomyces collinus]|uniref:FUSC family protein n=1 Tax=Streptomyces collinus TaxID=42684 RepID=UPI002943D932|nr:FUSC family protein [Streptomyces collinus]